MMARLASARCRRSVRSRASASNWALYTETAAVEAMKYQRDISREATASGIEFLREKGMEVYEPSAEELAVFKEATQPAFDTWAEKVGPELVQAFQSAIDSAN